MSAVISAGPTTRPHAKRRPWPLLLAAFGGAAAALLLAWLIFGLGAQRPATIAMQDDIVSLERGETHTAGGVVVTRSASGELSVRALPVAPKIIERVTEVPVHVPVEVLVEVPVDRIVEVPVEVRVEVERGPWFTVDTAALATALLDAGKELRSGMLAIAAARRAPANAPPPAARAAMPSPRLAQGSEADDPMEAGGASLRVRRTDGRMTLETAGTIEELVPTLLAQLTTPDTELQSLIERRLAAIHEQAASDPFIRSQLVDMPSQRIDTADDEPSLFGALEDPAAPDSPAAAWAAWWQANAALIAQSSGF